MYVEFILMKNIVLEKKKSLRLAYHAKIQFDILERIESTIPKMEITLSQ